jgi:hypothetical protein
MLVGVRSAFRALATDGSADSITYLLFNCRCSLPEIVVSALSALLELALDLQHVCKINQEGGVELFIDLCKHSDRKVAKLAAALLARMAKRVGGSIMDHDIVSALGFICLADEIEAHEVGMLSMFAADIISSLIYSADNRTKLLKSSVIFFLGDYI